MNDTYHISSKPALRMVTKLLLTFQKIKCFKITLLLKYITIKPFVAKQ